MNNPVEYVRQSVQAALDDLAKLFVSGAKLTFVARIPGNDDADFVITADSLDELQRLIARRQAALREHDEGGGDD